MKCSFALVARTQWDVRNASGSRVFGRRVKQVDFVLLSRDTLAVDLRIPSFDLMATEKRKH